MMVMSRRASRFALSPLFRCTAFLVTFTLPLFAQLAQITHFVAPAYPPLARQALITGHVTIKLTVDKTGTVADVVEAPEANPILMVEARKCVREWRFEALVREQPVTVTFYFGFSGDVKESNPVTRVKADFRGSAIHVYITTDPAPSVHR